MKKKNSGISREDVLKAARRAFAVQGYKETSLDDVAAEYNVTRQAIYYYFRTKRDILNALLGQFFDELHERAAHAAATASSPSEAFESMLRSHISYVASVPDLAAIFTREMNGLSGPARRELEMKRKSYHDAFVEKFKIAQISGSMRDLDPNAVVSLLLGAANWTYRWFKPNAVGRMSCDDIATFAINLFSEGYARRTDEKTCN